MNFEMPEMPMKKVERNLTLRIEEPLRHKFEYVSKYHGRSMNWMLLYFIRKSVAEFEKQHGEIPESGEE